MVAEFFCPLPSFSIFTRETCPWPHAHVLAPLTVYLHTRDPVFTIFLTIFWEVIETWLVAAIGEAGETSLQNMGSNTCTGLEEAMDDSLIGDFLMGVAGLVIGIMIVWSTRAARFVSLRRWHVMVLEIAIELAVNFVYAYTVSGVYIMIYIRPTVVIIVELLGWRYWHEKKGADLRPIILWIGIELIFVVISFVPLNGGSFYQNTFMSIGLAMFLCICFYFLLRVDNRSRRNDAIYGFHILSPDRKEMMLLTEDETGELTRTSPAPPLPPRPEDANDEGGMRAYTSTHYSLKVK